MSEQTTTPTVEGTAPDGDVLIEARGVKVHFPIKRGVIFDKTIGHVYAVDGVENGRWQTVETPWGEPSDAIYTGRVGHMNVAFLPRHGRGHRIAPSDINARANIDALKRLGVTDVLAVSSVGALVEARPPGQGEALQRPAVLRQRQMQPVQVRQVAGDPQPLLARLIGQAVGLDHPPGTFSGSSRMPGRR